MEWLWKTIRKQKGSLDLMITPESRYCLARTGMAVIGEKEFRIPAILYATEEEGFVPKIGVEGADFKAPLNPLTHAAGPTSEFLPSYMRYSSLMKNAAAAHVIDSHGSTVACHTAGNEIVREIEKYAAQAELLLIGSAAELSHDPYELATTLVKARVAAGFRKLLYVPGVANPQNLALLIYAGCDITDSLNAQLMGARGLAFVNGDIYREEVLRNGVCSCPSCSKGVNAELHNLFELRSELNRCVQALKEHCFREYVERMAGASAWNNEFLRYLDSEMLLEQEATAPNAGGVMKCITEHSFRRAEIMRYVMRIKERYAPPPLEVLLLVPCSMRKPYFKSRSHRLFESAIVASGRADAVHTVVITSPLGIVPEELETAFPSANYDIPVTGQWTLDEQHRSLSLLELLLKKGNYRLIISHLEDEREFVNKMLRDTGVDFIDTSGGRTRGESSLRRLTEALQSADYRGLKKQRRLSIFLSNIAAYQLGEGGRALMEGAECRGRYPDIRIIAEGAQIGMLTSARGVISLTLKGAERIAHVEGYTVWKQDFPLKGNLFAAGVEHAGGDIREGDEVIVRDAAGIAAVGVAAMSSREMNERGRGLAVNVRHRRPV